jgi:ABC-type dipeptide/oligopeptide/nickel transport system ATPase component
VGVRDSTRLTSLRKVPELASKSRTYYVSWIGKHIDPWDDWGEWARWNACGRPDHEPPKISGKQNLVLLPQTDSEWPGVPALEDGHAPVVGPIISDLFHPRSDRLLGLPNGEKGPLHRAFLLSARAKDEAKNEAKNAEVSKQVGILKNAIDSLISARKWTFRGLNSISGAEDIVQYPSLEIDDPSDHEQIINALRKWVRTPRTDKNPDGNPFDLGSFDGERLIKINLSSGTASMHACWMMFHWAGGFSDSDVRFFRGDSRLKRGTGQAEEIKPNRHVEFDKLTKWFDIKPAAPNEIVPERTVTEAFEKAYEICYGNLISGIEKAAKLRLPITLVGERGSGKTLLARKYHEALKSSAVKSNELVAESEDKQNVDKKGKDKKGKEKDDVQETDDKFVTLTLSEHKDVAELRDQLFGWEKGAFTGADQAFIGYLGMTNRGTLFLDEIHHLPQSLQAALLGPLNDRKYRSKPAGKEAEEKTSGFGLVVATNDPSWESKLTEDFRDRIKRIVFEVPSFREMRRLHPDSNAIWLIFQDSFEKRCKKCEIHFSFPDPLADSTGINGPDSERDRCLKTIKNKLEHHPLPGNWRDIQRLVDQLLFHLYFDRGGPNILNWKTDIVDQALESALS